MVCADERVCGVCVYMCVCVFSKETANILGQKIKGHEIGTFCTLFYLLASPTCFKLHPDGDSLRKEPVSARSRDLSTWKLLSPRLSQSYFKFLRASFALT